MPGTLFLQEKRWLEARLTLWSFNALWLEKIWRLQLDAH
jgi:hypothetical protein